LEAYRLKTDAQRTSKLERIRSARPTGAGFTVRPGVDLSLRHSGLAFSPEDAVTWATVRFDPRWHSYLEDRGADCRPRTDGSLEVRMPYHDENWIAREILRYLGDAVLEHPASARRLVRELASTLVVRYRAERAIRPGTGPAEDGP
jgi:predicted DNA-binding transcriptional regulator YafY